MSVYALKHTTALTGSVFCFYCMQCALDPATHTQTQFMQSMDCTSLCPVTYIWIYIYIYISWFHACDIMHVAMQCIHFLTQTQARMYLSTSWGLHIIKRCYKQCCAIDSRFLFRVYLDLKMSRGCMQRMRATSFIRTAIVEHNPTIEPRSLWVDWFQAENRTSNVDQRRLLQLMDCAGSELLFWSPWRRGSQGSHHCHQAVCQATAWHGLLSDVWFVWFVWRCEDDMICVKAFRLGCFDWPFEAWRYAGGYQVSWCSRRFWTKSPHGGNWCAARGGT